MILRTRSVSQSACSNLHILIGLFLFAAFAASDPLDAVAQDCTFRVLIAYADSVPPTTIQNQIQAEPGVTAVDLFDASSGTPTLQQLQQYNIVFAFSNIGWNDSVAMGNVLADYQDGGGVVVVGTFAWDNRGSWLLGGRWVTFGYSPFNSTNITDFIGNTANITQPSHPLMQGVSSLSAFLRNGVTLALEASAVALWTDGPPAVAYKTQNNGHTAVGLNGCLNHNFSGQWGRVIVNAGRWLTCGGTPTFNNLIINAGFENGSFSPWVIDGIIPTPVVTTAQAHSGTHSVFLGTISVAEPNGDSSFYQQITVPAAGGTLSYWWWGVTADVPFFDFQDVYVTNTSGTILATISHTCTNTGGWVKQTFDMAPYAGQTVRIKFLVHEDGHGDNTAMYVDDVELTSPNANYVIYNSTTRQTAVWRLNNNVLTGGVFGPTLPAGWRFVGAADFTGSLNPDYLLFDASTRQSAIWYLSGTTFVSGAFGPTIPSSWVLVTTTDFNNSEFTGYVLYQPATRKTAIWLLNNNVLVTSAYGPTLPAGWSLVGTADFNRDGHRDYLLFNASTRQTAIWYLSGVNFVSSAYGPTVPSGWVLVTTADFNSDGHPDYVLYQPATQKTAIWYLNNNVFVSSAYGPSLPAGWSLMDALSSVP